MCWTETTPVGLALIIVVPDDTPTFDQVADGLTSQLEFVTGRLKTFKETKLRREVVMKRLQKVHGRRDELRREMYKPCGLFTATSHRSWLLDRRHQELEKFAQDKSRNPTIVMKTSQTDQKKQKEPSDQEEEMEKKNPTSFANVRGSVSREREDWNSSSLNKDSFMMFGKAPSPKCKVVKMTSKAGQEGLSEPLKQRLLQGVDPKRKRDSSQSSWDDDLLPKIMTSSELNKLEKKLMVERERLDHIIHLCSTQIAPLLDRTGRLCIDIAPHLAMTGHHAKNRTYFEPLDDETPANLYSSRRNNRSFSNRNSYRFANGHLDTSSDHDQVMNPINVYLNPLSTLTQNAADRQMLNTVGGSVHFEVPVMLNPGELMATNSRQSSLIGESDVHLQISAHVSLPRTLG